MPKKSKAELEAERMKQNLVDLMASRKGIGKVILDGHKSFGEPPEGVTHSIFIRDLYEAPNITGWNNPKPFSEDDKNELINSIAKGGQMEAIIVWEIPKERVLHLYEETVPIYSFNGSRYMILSGHRRVIAHQHLFEETKEEKYTRIDAVIKKDITEEQARYIVEMTNKATGGEAYDISIEDLYEAPSTPDWNNFKPLNDDKRYELIQSIVDGGQLVPIIVWEIPQNKVAYLYEDVTPSYSFEGSKYMILSGHNRADVYQYLYQATGEEKYNRINAIIKRDLSEDQAKYIIKVTNYVQRTLTVKEKREMMWYMHCTLAKEESKGSKIAARIAEDTGMSPRSVRSYRAVNSLIPELIELCDQELISIENGSKLAQQTESMQRWLYENHKDRLNNKYLKGVSSKYTKKEEFENLFKRNENSGTITIKVQVPAELEKELRRKISYWIKDNK